MRRRLFKRWTRAVAIIAALLSLAGGVTFAALTSPPADLTGNTIETANANLLISTDGVTYAQNHSGFDFSGLVPGGSPAPTAGYTVDLKNAGSTPLLLRLSLGKTVSNPQSMDLNKVHFILSPLAGGAPQNITLQSLVDGGSAAVALNAGTRLAPGQVLGYSLQVSLETDAVFTPSASLSGVDLDFLATATN